MDPNQKTKDADASVSGGAESTTEANEQEGMSALMAQIAHSLGKPVSDRRVQAMMEEAPDHEELHGLALVAKNLGLTSEARTHYPEDWMAAGNATLLAVIEGKIVGCLWRGGDVTAIPDNTKRVDEVIAALRGCKNFLLLAGPSQSQQQFNIYENLKRRAVHTWVHASILSFFINAFALAVPFITMAVYSKVIGGHAEGSLSTLISGGLIVLVTILMLRRARSGILASEKARLSGEISAAVDRAILSEPLAVLSQQSQQSLSAQRSSAEHSANIFATTNITAFFDAPFIFLSILAIAYVGGWMALIPGIYLLAFAILGWSLSKSSSRKSAKFNVLSREKASYDAMLETRGDELRESGSEAGWVNRYGELADGTAQLRYHQAVRMGAIQSIGYVLGTGTALLTLIVGVDLAIVGVITSGELMGVMLLTWRVTGPAQAGFLALPQITAIRTGWSQLKVLLMPAYASRSIAATEVLPDAVPKITFDKVSFRYDAEPDMALSGTVLDIKPGEVIVVLGPNGSGKTTILRAMAGLLSAQSGSVLLDGRNISQFNPDDLLQSFTYIPTGSDIRSQFERLSNSVVCLLDDPYLPGEKDKESLIDLIGKRRGEATIVVATHDVFLADIADNVLIMNRGSVVYFGPSIKPDQKDDKKLEMAS
jgi:ATP-binding cassette, subfamily C, bacterial LapB